MKKLFTLMAAALFAVSASAKEAIDVSSLYSEGTTINFDGTWQWKGINMSTGSLVEDKDAKTADDSGVTYYDASAFDYIVVKYSASTADVSLIAQYNCKGTIGQYGAEYNQGQITIDKSATGGIIGLALDATYKKTINAIALQNGNATGTLTIEEVYFATEAEWEAVKPAPPTTKEIDFTTFGGYVAANKNFVFKAGEAGWYSKWIGTLDPDYFKYLVVEVASSTGDVQLVIQGTKADGASPAENLMITKTESAQTFYADIEGWSNISQLAFQNFNFSDPENEDWNAKAASAMETTMVITAMYLSKDAPSADGGEESATPVSISWGADDIAAKGTLNGKTFGKDFKLTITDTADGGKLSIDENSAYFGDADNQIKFTHRLKTGGKSDSKNNMTLTIPSDGTLKVYVRTGSNSATDRNLVLSQSGTELYNKVVLESDAVKVKGLDTKEPDKETNVYPIISVSVKAGTVDVTYPTNSLNFYGFEFIGTTGIQETIAPAKVISNGAIYNLAGQKVNENYKGIVIKNGKKFIQK